MSKNEIVPLVETQIEASAHAIAQAFQDDPLFTYVLPNHNERRLRLAAHLAVYIRYGYLFGAVFTTTGTPQGAAVWQHPGSDITAERAASAGFNRLSNLIGLDAVQRLGRVIDYLEVFHHGDLAPEHWYLMAVGVVPTRQRQGMGRALLLPGLNRADADGLPCYLDTALAENIPFYQKLGFRILVETVEPESGLRFWTLQRDPLANLALRAFTPLNGSTVGKG